MKSKDARKDVFLDQWVFAEGEGLRRLVNSTTAKISTFEIEAGIRQRRRRGRDAAVFLRLVDLIICNIVIVAHKHESTGRVVYSRDKSNKRSRYDNSDLLSKMFGPLVSTMEHMAVLRNIIGTSQTGRSTFEPTQAFLSQLTGITLSDLGWRDTDEVIVLKTGRFSEHNGDWLTISNSRRVEYDDTDVSHALRAEMLTINDYLNAADICLKADELLPVVDTTARRLRRYFGLLGHHVARFDKGGRLFGGWWMNLEKSRRDHVRIDGEECVLLDFRNMYLRLAYAWIDTMAPEGDLYDLTGLLVGYDNARATSHRTGTKKIFNALLYGGASKGKYPNETKDLMPKGCRVGDVTAALARKHPDIAPLFGTHIGYDLTLLESRILVKTLLFLIDKNITALPLHDGILVRMSHAHTAKSAMLSLSKEVCGYEIPVDLSELAQNHDGKLNRTESLIT